MIILGVFRLIYFWRDSGLEYVIVFSDTSAAILAERCLTGAGVPVSVMPLPESIGAGCGITLRVGAELRQSALGALADNGVRVLAVYSRERTDTGYLYEKIGDFYGAVAINS